ncbi:tRNA epoxyqueuosine(34) reductase QueG [Luteithermobacter gelatinilyticus]|uniref:tRNA epoxyqueuosine(34) reductase QueG n=1 Tax=Luteithermobacter gelatinilyticus TaxID=2582913 RepID=UPI0011065811|nr:tRNA epoxyqueuosine(34) reductase QueG [Luteithermobacter gelatinilyticus]
MSEIRDHIIRCARDAGFDTIRFTGPDQMDAPAARLEQFLELGRHGDMTWMAEKKDRRKNPRTLWPEVRSIIMLGMNYAPRRTPLERLAQMHTGNISVYARGRDYHDIVKKKLKTVARQIHRDHAAGVKVFVDTAPVMEKPLAAKAGIGWQGKHTNLVSREYGSWLFLGSIFTTLDLPPDRAEKDHCGSCRNCLDICPTNAFPAPYQLDARRCISYLTIEYKGHIAEEFRSAMGNRIYGCDDCLAVCPWNKFAKAAAEAGFFSRVELDHPDLGDLLGLDEPSFRQVFSGSPVKRTGRDYFIRNVLIAIGNSNNRNYIPLVKPKLQEENPIVRAMAVWALFRLMTPREFSACRHDHYARETDLAVRTEWDRAEKTAGPYPG